MAATKRRNRDSSSRQEIIYVRVAEEVKMRLADFLEDNPDYSERLVIERLLTFFNDLPEEEKKELLKEDRKLISISKLVGLLGWAEHAFQGQRWEWALRSFQSLDNFHPMSGELRSLMKYKQGFCALDIAIALRAEGFLALAPVFDSTKNKPRRSTPPGDAFDVCRRNLDDADTALRMSIVYHEENPDENPVVEYNTACGWVLRCQYLIEKALVEAVQTKWNQGGRSHPIIERLDDLVREVVAEREAKPVADRLRDLVSEIVAEADTKPKRAATEVATTWWEKFGPVWRDELGQIDEKLLTKIQRHADKAFKALDELIRGREEGTRLNAVPMTDAEYLIRMAKEDSDFLFLQCDTGKDGLRSRFDEWTSHAKGKDWMHETFRSIFRHMSQEKREKVNNLDLK